MGRMSLDCEEGWIERERPVINTIVWKLNRLQTMALPEIGHRVRQTIRIWVENLSTSIVRQPPPPLLGHIGKPWLNPIPRGVDVDLYSAAADRVLAGYFDVFSLRNANLGFPPNWNRDPKTGTEAPLTFGKSLNYRDEEKVGNIKYLWEPSRHLQLTSLAQAYHLTGDVRYAEGARLLLESWFDQCPYPMGHNWSSSLESAIRLVNWAFTWYLLGGAASPLFTSDGGHHFKRRWLDNIYQHCHFIAGYLSRHSSANNHLFGELTGLYVAAMTWPCWHESSGWLQLARDELETEVRRQNAPDGVNREQAIYYQHEVADMMLICWLVGRANGVEFSQGFIALLERMLEFIASIMDVSGHVPMIGDADDALWVHWSQEPDWHPYRSLLATGAVLFDRPDFKAKAGRFDDKSRWLLGDAANDRYEAIPCRYESFGFRREFPEGGYFILGDRFETPDEIRLIADAGPLGYLSIAAHGHADALAFTLSIGGRPLLIDPGTYAYHTQRKWRDYFRGTSAHNTVRVDGLDQSEPGGNFMWLRKANACCEAWQTSEERDCFIGSHDGYLRLSDPVMHRRKITFLKRDRTVVVEDILECRKVHDIELFWHFSDTCDVFVEERKVSASCGNLRVEITMPDCGCEPEMVEGREAPPLGWISRRFDEKVPSPSIVWKEKINGTTTLVTIFRLSASP